MIYLTQMENQFKELAKYIGLHTFHLDVMPGYDPSVYIRFTKQLPYNTVIKSPVDIKTIFGPIIEAIETSPLVKDIELRYENKIKDLETQIEQLKDYKTYVEMQSKLSKV